MAKKKTERGDWLTLQVQVTATWPDGSVTIEHRSGQKVTLRGDSDEIVEVTKREKPPRRTGLFDKQE